MADNAFNISEELTAIQAILTALQPLNESSRKRVVDYVISRLDMKVVLDGTNQEPAAPVEPIDDKIKPSALGAAPFSSFAELFDAAQPKSTADKALVAGYWLQVCQGADTFDGQSANRELKHLGQGLSNVTNAIDGLKSQKPALALQLRKSGKSQQARKIYKITVAGVKAVESLTNG